MLQSAGRLKTPFGQRAFAILLFQDLSIIPLITLVAVMSGGPEASRPGWQLALITVGAIVGLILAGRYLIRPLFGLISSQGERELFVVAALFTIIASAAVDGIARPFHRTRRLRRGRHAGGSALPS